MIAKRATCCRPIPTNLPAIFTIIALQQLPKVKYIWMLTLKLMITSHMNVHRYMTFHAKKLVDEIPSWQVNQILFLYTISILDFKEEICWSKSKPFFLQEPSTNSQFRWGYDHNLSFRPSLTHFSNRSIQ